MNYVTLMIIPLLVLSIIIYGYKKSVNIYDSFLDGAKDGLGMSIKIFPTYVAMIFAVNVFVKSNFLEFAFSWLGPILAKISLPINILPMVFLRPISGSAVFAILNDILATYGPDSFVGRIGSTIMGSSDTTLYILALYFGSVKITKTKHALKVGIFSDICAIIASFIVVKMIFG